MASQNTPQWQPSGTSNSSQYHNQQNMRQGPNFSFNQLEQQASFSHGQKNRGPNAPAQFQSSAPQYPPSVMPGHGSNQPPPFDHFPSPAPPSGPHVPLGQQLVPMAPPQPGFGPGFPHPPPFPRQPRKRGEPHGTSQFPSPMEPPPPFPPFHGHQQPPQSSHGKWHAAGGPPTNQHNFQPPNFPPGPPQQNPNSWSSNASGNMPGRGQSQHQEPNSFPQKAPARYDRPPNQQTMNKVTPQGRLKNNNADFKSKLQPYQSHRIRMQKKENHGAGNFHSRHPPEGFQGRSAGFDLSLPMLGPGGFVPCEGSKEERVEESPDQKWVNQWLKETNIQPQPQELKRKHKMKVGLPSLFFLKKKELKCFLWNTTLLIFYFYLAWILCAVQKKKNNFFIIFY